MKKLTLSFLMLAFIFNYEASGQWTANDNDIYNTNIGNVGIGNSTPLSLLFVAKNMAEPTITVRNLGGAGGATYRMWDNASGADWKFKATNAGGFKIRDNAYSIDVFTIESGSFANAFYIKSTDNIGIGTATPAITALVDMTSTGKGFLPPRMTTAQIEAIVGPADGLVVYCSTNGKMYIYVASASQWKEMAYGSGTISPICGFSKTINHVAGNVAPVTKTVVYSTVTNIPGETSKCWITSNLGASHQADSVDDNTEASAGWYWQFNRMRGFKHDGTTRTPNTTWITSISENLDWLAANDPCALELGSGWRIPTITEWTNVDAAGVWADWNGPWNSVLKIHAAGNLSVDFGTVENRGSYGWVWSSSRTISPEAASNIHFRSSLCGLYNSVKSFGMSVRCIKG